MPLGVWEIAGPKLLNSSRAVGRLNHGGIPEGWERTDEVCGEGKRKVWMNAANGTGEHREDVTLGMQCKAVVLR
jgi:hypothetical protein